MLDKKETSYILHTPYGMALVAKYIDRARHGEEPLLLARELNRRVDGFRFHEEMLAQEIARIAGRLCD